MYFYIYDNFLTDKKYQNLLSRIETKITDFGMSGKIVRMSVLKNLKSTIDESVREGVKTIVIIGNDKTLNQAINLLDNQNVIIGFIPVGPGNEIKDILGIPEGEAAIDILSARLIQNMHFGLINGKYRFLTYLELAGDNATINCDNDYFVSINDKSDIITISNIYFGEFDEQLPIINNQDKINLIVRPANSSLLKHKSEKYSYFTASHLRLESAKPLPILLMDEKTIIKTPITVSGSKETLRMIVGKKRMILN